MISYAQNFEDVLLRRALQDIETGFYVDIGAQDPSADSVTRWFYDLGWSGVNVEPVPAFLEALRRYRPRDVNLGVAIGAEPGRASFTVVPGTGLSTLFPEHLDREWRQRSFAVPVEVVTLDGLLSAHAANRTVDFLKVDVEGAEGRILSTASFSAHRPRILVVEAVVPLQLRQRWGEWEPGLLAKGYRFAWFDGLNRFYVREEDAWRLKHFEVPPHVFDQFVRAGEIAPQKATTEREDTLSGDLAVAQRAVTALRADVAELYRWVAALLDENAALLARSEAVEASVIWRATAPLRGATDIARRSPLLRGIARRIIRILRLRRRRPTMVVAAETALSPQQLDHGTGDLSAALRREMAACIGRPSGSLDAPGR